MSAEVTNQNLVEMYRDMRRVRQFETALEREFKRGNVPGKYRLIPGGLNKALRSQIVDFVRLCIL